MELGYTIELIRGANELAKTFSAPAPNNPRQFKAIQKLIDALRLIYFAPKGVLVLLRDIADGGYPSEEKIAALLPEFNEGEHWVNRARHDLEDSRLRDYGNLSLRANRVLGEIAYGKGGIRSKVQSLLNHSLTFGEKISAEEASQLIEEISLLNEAIEEAEEKLAASIK